jgi:hypothetical protein
VEWTAKLSHPDIGEEKCELIRISRTVRPSRLVESLTRRRQAPDLVPSRIGEEFPASLVKPERSVAAHFEMDAKNQSTMRLFGVRRPAAALPGAQSGKHGGASVLKFEQLRRRRSLISAQGSSPREPWVC